MIKIINVVICYANEDEVIAYARALDRQTVTDRITLVVVVNKEGFLGCERLKYKLNFLRIDTQVYQPNENLGYMNGLIYGYRRYTETTKDIPKWVVMSNTDIEFSNDNFFEDFLEKKYDENVFCVAPSIYLPLRNSYINPHYIKRFTIDELNRRIFIFERIMLTCVYKKLHELKDIVMRQKKKNSQYVYSAHGCFFIIRDDFAEVLKYKKHKVLMYSEEIFIAENIRACGKMCYYDNSIEVIHNACAVVGKLGDDKRTAYLLESLKAVRDEFFI